MPQIPTGTLPDDGTGASLYTTGRLINQWGQLNDKTVNAAFYKTSGITTEAALNLAIPAAALLGTGATVWVPQSMQPFNAALVSFNQNVHMSAEGSDWPTDDVRGYGAAGDGVTDDFASLNAAFSRTGQPIRMSRGNYFCSTGLNQPTCLSIVGVGSGVTPGASSSITFAAGVTKGLPLGTASAPLTLMAGFSIYGNATPNAVGIAVGDQQLVANVLIEDVRVWNWSGSGAIGWDIRDCTKMTFIETFVSGSTTGVRLKQGTQSTAPTTCSFEGCEFRSASDVGCLIRSGNSLLFHNCIFENNTHEGMKVIPDVAGQVAFEVVLQDCWFEGNWLSDLTQYNYVQDGTTANVRSTLRGGNWNSSARSIHITNSEFILDCPGIANTANAVVIDGGATGTIVGLPNYVAYSTAFAGASLPTLVRHVNGLRGFQQPGEAVLVSGVDATKGDLLQVTLSAARLVGAPLNPMRGQELTFELSQNGTGGFAVTWNAVFLKSWSDVGNTANKTSTVVFIYDGGNWVQRGAQSPYM